LLNIPNVNIKWPNEIKVPMDYIKAFVDFDLLQSLATLASAKAKELDVHVMLILKNSALPLIVSILVIVPMKRWYYVTWWLIAMSLAVTFACCTAAMSFFAQKPFDVDWLTSLHYQSHMYFLTYKPGTPILEGEYSVGSTDSSFSPILVGILSGGVALTFILFFVTVGIGILLWGIRALLNRRRFNNALNEMKRRAPPGKKVNVSKLKYRMVFEQVRAKQAEELDLKLRTYWTRIAPLFLILIAEVISVAIIVWLRDYLNDNSPNATLNHWLVYVVYGLVLTGICAVVCCFLGCNSLILFERMRKIIFIFNNFITSKALKVTFLVLSSFYIPLAVSIFSMFDCAQTSCPEGSVFTNRKDDISASGYFSRLLEQLIRSPEICTSCQFSGAGTNFTTLGSNAAMCPSTMLADLCPGGSQPRLLRQPSISCAEIYPYVAASGALCCLFVITTPFLIFYLIKLATKQLGSVEIPHLLKYEARKRRRAYKNKLEKRRKSEVLPADLPPLESFLNHQVDSKTKKFSNQTKRSLLQRLFLNNPVKDLSWEIRIALVDCSVESLYFPFKFRWRYFKLVFLVAKVILSFTNVFGVTLFGTHPKDNAIGPQLVLWTTLVVQALLGLLTFVLRPHMILAETILMIVASLSICANCAFGLVITYSKVEMPGLIAIAFMACNSVVLGIAAIMSLVFYVYRVRKNNYKSIQKRMKRLLKARTKKASLKKKKNTELSQQQIDKYWKGIGRKKREPYLDLDMTEHAGKVLKDIKSAQKYQSAVAYSLNRTSLDTLINFFFFLSVVTSISGVLLATHYVLLFLNPGYVDPYLQTRLEVFSTPLNVEQKGYFDVGTFADWGVENLDTTPGRSLLRNETETALDSRFQFATFPSSMCEEGYNLTFAGYNNWQEFTDNCCCTRDLEFEQRGSERTNVYFRNLNVEMWRCRNGLVKRRIRKLDMQFSAVVSPSFIIGADNFVDNYISLDGYGIRDFCSTTFKPNFAMTQSKERDCEGKDRIESYEGVDLTTVSELWDDPMVIRAQYTTAQGGLFEGSTVLTNLTMQNREYYGVVWDSVKSVVARSVLF